MSSTLTTLTMITLQVWVFAIAVVGSLWVGLGLASILYFLWRHGLPTRYDEWTCIPMLLFMWPMAWDVHFRIVDEEKK